MIYITGDTHGSFENLSDFCNKNKTTIDDTIIILGDVGLNYYLNSKDDIKKKFVASLPITLFCIHGNHECRPSNIDSYIETEYLGGVIYKEMQYPNILFAKDGECYNFKVGNKEFNTLVIGGAYSVDKFYRKLRGFKWFSDEQPSEAIKNSVITKLNELNWQVDVVLTHTCPLKYEPREWFLPIICQKTVDKSTEKWLDTIEEKLEYTRWYCGHYHGSKNIDKIQFMFQDYDYFVERV